MNLEATLWLVLMIGFIIVEAACPFHLVSVWFAVGSLVAMIAALLYWPLWLQITLFLVVSCGLLALLFPWVKKVLQPKIVKTNVDAIAGTQGYVTADVDNISAVGQVKLGGMEWTARSTSGENIPAGTLVKVDRIEGVKAFVSPVKVKEEVSL
ncbi:MAG: NfeD family protein [Oscillospiraceae bacterium]|nr:NfeD family protein [Oscillospiraceae bacterium]